jgi:hypothetical protein
MKSARAFSALASDEELAELLSTRQTDAARTAGKAAADPWCFVEGPLRSEFTDHRSVDASALGVCWFVRLFGSGGEVAARRTGFDSERCWMVRVIAEAAPRVGGVEWTVYALGDPEPGQLVLLGARMDGAFPHGSQFRDPFDYPGVRCAREEAAALRVETLNVEGAGGPNDAGGPIVRWLALDRSASQPAKRREDR